MASTIATNHPSQRQDTFRVDTRDVRVNRLQSGRVSPATKEQVQSLADSIAEHGQRQPVEFVKDSAGNLTLVFGFTRFDALELLNTNKTNDQRILLWGVVKSATVQNAEDCLVHNIVENAHRHATNAIDDATNQNRLRTEFGWPNTRIASLYRMSEARVSQLSKLLDLIPAIRKLVIQDVLTCAAAEELATLDVAGQKQWLESRNSTGETPTEKISTADVREDVATQKRERGEKAPGMTLAALRKWLKSVSTTDDPDVIDSVKGFADVFLQFTSGEADESDVWNAIDQMTGQEKPKRRKAG